MTTEGILVRQIGENLDGSKGNNLYRLYFIAVLGDGKTFVVSDIHNDCLHVVTTDGKLVRQIGNCVGSLHKQFKVPSGVCVAAGGVIVVSDAGNGRLLIIQ